VPSTGKLETLVKAIKSGGSEGGRERLSVGVVTVGGAVGQASRADARVRVRARAIGRAGPALIGGRVGAGAGTGRRAALGSARVRGAGS
jgi:hypothetical protein